LPTRASFLNLAATWNIGGAKQNVPISSGLDDKDVVDRLRSSVKRAGGQSTFSRQTGLNRTHVNHVLTGKRLPSWSIIDALNLGVVYVLLDQYDDLAVRKLGHTRSR
jgi:hypothetical protein